MVIRRIGDVTRVPTGFGFDVYRSADGSLSTSPPPDAPEVVSQAPGERVLLQAARLPLRASVFDRRVPSAAPLRDAAADLSFASTPSSSGGTRERSSAPGSSGPPTVAIVAVAAVAVVGGLFAYKMLSRR